VTRIRGIAPTVAASVVTPPNGVPLPDCRTRRGSLARIVFADTTSGPRALPPETLDRIGVPRIEERCGYPNLADVPFQDRPRLFCADLLGHD